MSELTVVRENLMNEPDYSPYCGNNVSRNELSGCHNPRTYFINGQFKCPNCGWISKLPDDFIKRYKEKWGIK